MARHQAATRPLILDKARGRAARRHAAWKLLFVALCGVALMSCESAQSALEGYITRSDAAYQAGDFAAAVVELKSAASEAPDDVPVRLRLARAQLRAGDAASAEKDLGHATRLGASSGELSVLLASTRLAQGKFKDVLELTRDDKAMETFAVEQRAALNALKGRAAAATGRFEDAKQWLDAALELVPGLRQANLGRAEVAEAQGDDEAARKYLGLVLADLPATAAAPAAPVAAQAAFAMSRLHLRNGNVEEALAALDTTLRLEPLAVAPAVARAQALITVRRPEEAVKALDALEQRGVQGLRIRHLRSVIAFSNGEIDKAKQLADENLSRSASYAPSLQVAGTINSLQGQDEAAVRQLSAVVGRGGILPRPSTRALALSYIRLGRPDMAEKVLAGGDLAQTDETIMHLAVALAAGDLERARALLTESLEAGRTGAVAGMADFLISTGEQAEAAPYLERLAQMRPPGDQARALQLGELQLRAGNPDKALALAREAQAGANPAPGADTLAGLALVAVGKENEAVEAFETALRTDPDPATAAVELARIYMRRDRGAEAKALLEQVLARHPDNGTVLLLLSQVAYDSGDPDAGERLMRSAAAKAKAPLLANILLARMLLRTDRLDEALSFSSKAQRLQPDQPDAVDVHARVNQALGRHEVAIAEFERLVGLRPDNAQDRFLLAQSLAAMGRRPDSIQQLRSALRIDTDMHEARLALARLLLAEGETDEVGEHVLVLAAALPKSAEVAQLAAAHAVATGDLPLALERYKRGYELNPTTAGAVPYANLLWSLGQREAAYLLLEGAKDGPDPGAAYRALAGLYIREERFADAQAQYRALVEKPGTAPGAMVRNDYAWTAMKAGDLATATDQAERAYALAPESAQVNDTLGAILLARGDLDRAVPLLRTALGKAPEDLDVQLNLATALTRAGKLQEAIGLLEPLAESQRFRGREEAKRLLERLR